MISPGAPATFSTFSLSSAATRYCLPPVLMTANIFSLVFGPAAQGDLRGSLGPASCSVGLFEVFTRRRRQKRMRTGRGPPRAMLMAGEPGPVKELRADGRETSGASGLKQSNALARYSP